MGTRGKRFPERKREYDKTVKNSPWELPRPAIFITIEGRRNTPSRGGKDVYEPMRQIIEQQIMALAPNPAAAANGRKISQKGGFVRLEASADDTFFLGECTGSGAMNYITTADFLDPGQPVFRCTCPSRQFPCKHSLALLYEMMSGKTFAPCEIPEDILTKRQKKEAKAAKAASSEKSDKAPPKVNKAARAKKLKKQLEGLDLAQKLVEELMNSGLGTMGGTALPAYRTLAKQLGDYYLPGPQRLLNGLILEIEAFQKDGEDRHYDAAIAALERLWALVRKSRQYLSAKVESGDVSQDDNLLFEELGGVWKFTELAEVGLGKANLRLCQLAFWVSMDEARGGFVDTGCWADLATGELSLTKNYRPLKALKYIKQDDSCFGVVETPMAVFYPGEGCRRVRWEGGEIRELTPDDLAALRGFAAPAIPAEAKAAKNLLKNTLGDPMTFRLVAFSAILRGEDGKLALRDGEGNTIRLGDAPWMEPTTHRLPMLPDGALLAGQTLLGGFWYDAGARRLTVQPLSIVTPEGIIRLLY